MVCRGFVMPEPRQLGQSDKQHSTAVTALVGVARHYGLTLDAQQLIRNNPF
jgi:hypothetical protein